MPFVSIIKVNQIDMKMNIPCVLLRLCIFMSLLCLSVFVQSVSALEVSSGDLESGTQSFSAESGVSHDEIVSYVLPYDTWSYVLDDYKNDVTQIQADFNINAVSDYSSSDGYPRACLMFKPDVGLSSYSSYWTNINTTGVRSFIWDDSHSDWVSIEAGLRGTGNNVRVYVDLKGNGSILFNPDGDTISFQDVSCSMTYDEAILAQHGFRFFENVDRIQPINAIAADNAAPQTIYAGQQIRLRMVVQSLSASVRYGQSFKLQYAQTANPSDSGTVWHDVGDDFSATAQWRYIDNPSVLAGEFISANLISAADTLGVCVENDSTIVTTPLTENCLFEFDWSIENYSAAQNTDYSFRMVESNGTQSAFNTYNDYPQLKTTFIPTNIYRSVGPGNTSDLNVDNCTFCITDGEAVFSGDMPENIGVGDVLQYLNGATHAIAFIYYRISPGQFLVKDVSGGSVPDVSAETAVSVYRAYTSLANAEAGIENTALHDSVENFDMWTGGRDLVTNNERWHIYCYADGLDTQEVTVDGWTTNGSAYLNIEVPYLMTDVGTRQMHEGFWSDGYYRLTSSMTAVPTLKILDDHVRVAGLQLMSLGTTSFDNVVQIGSETSEVSIYNCIIKGGYCGVYFSCGSGSYGGHKIYNNMIYNSHASGVLFEGSGQLSSAVYNNTIYNCNQGLMSADHSGINENDASVMAVVNNLVLGCYSNGTDDIDVGLLQRSFNITSCDMLAGTGCLDERTITDDPDPGIGAWVVVQSLTPGAEDLRLQNVLQNDALNSGFDLSDGYYCSFDTDFEGDERLALIGWDRGADEVVNRATSYTWGADFAGVWNNDGNWICRGVYVPGDAGDYVLFNESSRVPCVIDDPVSASELIIDAEFGSQIVLADDLTVVDNLSIGANSTVCLENGCLRINGNLYLAKDASISGSHSSG